MDVAIFLVSSLIVLGGALGVIFNANPVHAALSLIASFFGVAVLFLLQDADFLALVQVVVYAGAIVVLFLFVIMLLGVDRTENLRSEPLGAQRPAALVGAVGILVLVLAGLFVSGPGGDEGAVALTGHESQVAPIDEDEPNVRQLGQDLFGRNILAFQATALLLTIATVGAVVLVRNQGAEDLVVDEPGTSIE